MAQLYQGFLLSRHSLDSRHGTQISFWLSTDQGPARLLIGNEKPLFFIATSKLESAIDVLTQAQLPFEYSALELRQFDQTQVAALYFPTIQGHFKAQDLLKARGIECLEADFRLHDRYLMERFCQGGVEFTGVAQQKAGYLEFRQAKIRACDYKPKLSAVSLDIECSEHGELFSVGLQQVDGEELVIMIGPPQPAATPILWVSDERALLKGLESELQRLDPDLIIGWNIINFDMRLLMERAERHGFKLRLGRGGSYASFRLARNDSGQVFVTIPGRVVLDGIDGLKAATYSFESFALDSVAAALLGKRKLVDDVANRLATIEHQFVHDKPALAAYNLEDCRLVSEIFAKTELVDFLTLRSQLTGLELDRIGGSVAAFTNLYLPKLHRAGYVAPNLAESWQASPGGYVMSSKPGLYKHVLVLDFKSLYPSIIRTFKIDPLGLLEGLKSPDSAIPGFRGGYFSRDSHFLPQIITSLWQQRDEAKHARDSALSQAIKILMNSFYGVLGSSGCRFYDTRLASSITMRGHEIMQQTASWIEEQGYQVIYGDTDSTFVWLNGDYSFEQADAIGAELVADINGKWRDKLRSELALPCYLELEYETHFHRFLMPTIRGSDTGSKKRYAGLTGEGAEQQLIFKGLETVRTDWTELAKAFQTKLYGMVFADQDPTLFIQQTVAATLAGEKDRQLVYHKRLRRQLEQYQKNVPPHVKAARLADEKNQALGKPLKYQRKGSIAYLITLNGPEPLEYLSSPLDYQHYIERQLKPVADGILPFIGLSFDALTDSQLDLF